MSKYKCDFCKREFSSKANLNYHKTNTKYCLEKQGKQREFTCEECKKTFVSDNMLQKHHLKCVDYHKELMRTHYEKIISEKDKHIKELEGKLENIALKAISRPSVVNTTNTDNRIQQVINNLVPITDDHLKEQSRFLTLEHIKQGAVGYATFACEHALKDRVTCTDLSRRKIKYKNPEGQVVSDPEMLVISKKLFTAISEKNKELTGKYKEELINMILTKYREAGDDMKDEETKELDDAITELNKKMDHIMNISYQAKDIAEGQRPEMYHEFVKEVCSKTVT
jgi:Zinc finger, C2H2 type